MTAATTQSSPTPPPPTTKTQYTTTPQLPQITLERSATMYRRANGPPRRRAVRSPAIRVQRTTTPPPSPPHHHYLPTVPNVDSEDNSPYSVPDRTPSPTSPAYDPTSPVEPDILNSTTDNEPRPAYDNEIRENISHPIDTYLDHSEQEYDSEASWASSGSSYSSPSVDPTQYSLGMEPRPANAQQWIRSGLLWPLYAATLPAPEQQYHANRDRTPGVMQRIPNGIQQQLSGQHIPIPSPSRLACLGQLMDPIHQHSPTHTPQQMVPHHPSRPGRHLHPTFIATANTNRPH
jgi:hypothetical protein